MSDSNTSMPSASALLKSFVEAGNALEQLPKVQADLDETKALAQSYSDDLTSERGTTASLRSKIAELEAAIASKEAALADATFRHEAVSKVLDVIRGALPVHAVLPEPVHQVEPEVEISSSSSASTSASTSTEISTPPLDAGQAQPTTSTEREAEASAPATIPSSTPRSADGDTIASERSEFSPKPTPYPSEFSPTPEFSPYPTEDREPSGEANGLGANGQAPGSPSTTNTSAPGTSSEASASARLRPHWLKPISDTWQNWKDNGGEVPTWVNDLNAA
jgi:hypothetical protein